MMRNVHKEQYRNLKYCTEYSCEEYRNRSLGMKIRIGFSRLFRNLS